VRRPPTPSRDDGGADVSDFDARLSEMLGSAVEGASPPAALAETIQARIEGANVINVFAGVNAMTPSAALRERVAAGVTAAAIAAGAGGAAGGGWGALRLVSRARHASKLAIATAVTVVVAAVVVITTVVLGAGSQRTAD